MSAGRYLLIVFLFNTLGFGLLGIGLESLGEAAIDWTKVCGVALLMGILSADLVGRLGNVQAGEVRRGFGAYHGATRWILFLWATLLAALGLAAVAVRLLA